MQITVDNELKSYIRPLKDEEYEKLKGEFNHKSLIER